MRASKADIAGLPEIDDAVAGDDAGPGSAHEEGRADPGSRRRGGARARGLSDDDIRRAAMADISEQGSGDLGGCLDWLAPRDPRVGPR